MFVMWILQSFLNHMLSPVSFLLNCCFLKKYFSLTMLLTVLWLFHVFAHPIYTQSVLMWGMGFKASGGKRTFPPTIGLKIAMSFTAACSSSQSGLPSFVRSWNSFK